jgi:hypothetical protein
MCLELACTAKKADMWKQWSPWLAHGLWKHTSQGRGEHEEEEGPEEQTRSGVYQRRVHWSRTQDLMMSRAWATDINEITGAIHK